MILRPQYHFRPSEDGFFAWDVHQLIAASEPLPVFEHPLSDIAELDELWWFQSSNDRPTPRSIAEHAKIITAVDLSYPIILCAEGRLMDGMHRCLKALIEERSHVSARRFDVTPPPDHVNVQPSDLPYE